MSIYQDLSTNGPITPEESTRHSWQEEELRLQRAHDITIRQLELALVKQQQRWDSLLRIPMIIIKLPLYIVLAFGYIVAMARKHEPSESFWQLFK